MDWQSALGSFMGLALCWAGAERLLAGEGLRRAARMAFGLLAIMLWLGALQRLLPGALPSLAAPESLLASTAVSADPWAAYASHAAYLGQRALRQAGCAGEVRLTWAGGSPQASLYLERGEAEAARTAVAAALGLPITAVVQE